MKEKFSDLCHELWSGWMIYLFSKTTLNRDGSRTIPKEFVDRWYRQLKTPYKELSEEEKNSDRREAEKFMRLTRENELEKN